jgi:hypothetical protein
VFMWATSSYQARALHQQAGHMTAPDCVASASHTTLPKGRRPHMTVHVILSRETWDVAANWRGAIENYEASQVNLAPDVEWPKPFARLR